MEPTDQNEVDPQAVGSAKSRSSLKRYVLFVVLFLTGPALIPTFFVLNGGLENLEISVNDQFGNIEEFPGTNEKAINLWFQATDFNPETEKAQFLVYPWPSDDLAKPFDSSIQLNEDFGPIQVWVDSTSLENKNTFAAGEAIGAIEVEIDVINDNYENYRSDAFYPFDRYRMDAFAQTFEADSSDNEEVKWKAVKTFDFFYSTAVPGFRIVYERIANFPDSNGERAGSKLTSEIVSQRNQGLISFRATITRSDAVKTVALILGVFCVMSALTLTWISAGVWTRKRPPSMQALIWAAASVLGTVQLRDILPGRPRIGIAIDFIFFFPTLLIGLISSLLLTTLWIRRDDWLL